MSFSDLNLDKPILNALEEMGLSNPTSIQSMVFSPVMAGRDICALSQTGSGKTIAYLLPLLRMWTYSKDKLAQIMVIVPTTELVLQVSEVARKLAAFKSCDVVGVHGGVNPKVLLKEIQDGVDIIVCTPGRCIDLVNMGGLRLKNIKKVVLDEFDLMLDMGFKPQIEKLFLKLPTKRQHLMFSATYNEDINEWAEEHMLKHEIIESKNTSIPSQIVHEQYILPNFLSKINMLELMLSNDTSIQKMIVFVSEKKKVDLVLSKFRDRELEEPLVLHGNKSFNHRTKTIGDFKTEDFKILIASDLASRGLDIEGISHIINLDVPDPMEDYIHRAGRTGRNGKTGRVVSLISEMELDPWMELVETLEVKVAKKQVPSFLELSSERMPFEIPREVVKKLVNTVKSGEAFHEKSEKNKKVNVRRNIEKEKQKKYGKSYRKESKS